MPYTGLTKDKRTCAICAVDMSKGTLVYFDPTKSEANCLVHKVCYDELRASREVDPPKGKEVKSSIDLDAPF